MRARKFTIVALAVAVAGCSDPLGPAMSPPSSNIADGAHGSGNPSFFFLPPMVSNPGSGENVTGLAPLVDICAWDGTACSVTLAHFTNDLATTTTTQPGNSETVRQSGNGYIVNWHTRDFNLTIRGIYRVCVSLGGHALGHADVDVVGSAKDLKSVNTDEFIGLLDGRTLPIKFRIEAGAASEPADIGCGGQPE